MTRPPVAPPPVDSSRAVPSTDAIRTVRPPGLPVRAPTTEGARAATPSRPAPAPSLRVAARRRRRTEALERRRPGADLRRRRLIVLGGAGLVLVVLGGPLVLAFGPFFTVGDIRVVGADAPVTAAVRTALAPQLGRPIAVVGDADVARALATVPALERYSLVRRPPSTLELVVVTRTPVAQAAAGDDWTVLDAARVVLTTSAVRDAALPVVDVPAGRSGAAAYASAVAAIAALHGDPAVERVRARTADDVVLTLADGPRVRWGGAEDGAAKAEALRAALVRAADGATLVDVSAPGVVRTR